jgi:hypothetical protein
MRILAAWIGLALVIAVTTALLGWWTVPVVSALWTLALPRRGGVIIAALSGAAAWGTLLLLLRRDGPVGEVDRVLSGTLQLPPGAAVGLTLAYAALLAGAAALVAQSLRPVTTTSRVSSSSPSR